MSSIEANISFEIDRKGGCEDMLVIQLNPLTASPMDPTTKHHEMTMWMIIQASGVRMQDTNSDLLFIMKKRPFGY